MVGNQFCLSCRRIFVQIYIEVDANLAKILSWPVSVICTTFKVRVFLPTNLISPVVSLWILMLKSQLVIYEKNSSKFSISLLLMEFKVYKKYTILRNEGGGSVISPWYKSAPWRNRTFDPLIKSSLNSFLCFLVWF